jgi:hypothetical protein
MMDQRERQRPQHPGQRDVQKGKEEAPGDRRQTGGEDRPNLAEKVFFRRGRSPLVSTGARRESPQSANIRRYLAVCRLPFGASYTTSRHLCEQNRGG